MSRSSSPSSARASSPPTSTTTPAASPPTRWPARTSATRCSGRSIPITVALIVVQEMCARMGVVTGKGLADLIRENFGVRSHLLPDRSRWSSPTSATPSPSSPAWRRAWRSSASPSYISVPLAAAGRLAARRQGHLPARSRRSSWSPAASTSPTSSPASWPSRTGARWRWPVVTPQLRRRRRLPAMLIGIVGTTIAPWMQFYLQSAVVEKGIKPSRVQHVAAAT